MKRLIPLFAVAAMSMCGSAFAMDSSADMMKMADTNKDGKISMAEHDAHSKKMFGMMDTNKDGSVTAAEMDAGHKMMMKDNDAMMKRDTMMKGDKMGSDKMAPDKMGADKMNDGMKAKPVTPR